jgi:hypothetical protein
LCPAYGQDVKVEFQRKSIGEGGKKIKIRVQSVEYKGHNSQTITSVAESRR